MTTAHKLLGCRRRRDYVNHTHCGRINQYNLILHHRVFHDFCIRHSRECSVRQDVKLDLRRDCRPDAGGETDTRGRLAAVAADGVRNRGPLGVGELKFQRRRQGRRRPRFRDGVTLRAGSRGGVCATATPVIAAIPKIEIARRVVIEPS